MLNKEHAYYLLQKLMDGKASSTERATLSQLLKQDYPQDQWIELFEELFHAQEQTEQPAYDEETWKPVLEELLQNTRVHKPKVIPMWRRIAVAASIILFISFGIYVISTKEKSPAVVVSPDQQQDVPAPDKNRAQIKLSDGTIVYLDSAANGSLATQNNVNVIKTADGQIVYTPSAVTTPTAVTYNTLSNPRGSIVMHMTLSDGSKVWLNAGSSITYPVAFVSNERKITMTGEGYFEVAKDPTKKFIVEANGTSTEVLGTHFNVNAYDDEQEIKVTLLEGSVKVSNDVDAKIIKPGQQAVVILSLSKDDSQLTTITTPDLDQIMSWKNGYFNFSQESISTIMRELGRWYNTEIVFSGEKPDDKFSAIIKRSNNISQVLKMLEKTNRVHFTIEGLPDGKAGNKITVTR